MTRELDLKRRVSALSGLRDAVGAMKSLSAHHFRETRSVAASAAEYRKGVATMVSRVGTGLVAGGGPVGLVVVGAELGLCGGYTSRVVERAMEHRRETGSGPCIAVGKRAASMLRRRGVDLLESYPGPSGIDGLSSLLLDLAERLLAVLTEQQLSSLDVVSSHFVGVGAQQPEVAGILPPPLDAGASESPLYVPLGRFVSAVTQEISIQHPVRDLGQRACI
ncbi:MAG: F0F1 ATP synthase subunit gamma [Polyangiaceae bacterium]